MVHTFIHMKKYLHGLFNILLTNFHNHDAIFVVVNIFLNMLIHIHYKKIKLKHGTIKCLL